MSSDRSIFWCSAPFFVAFLVVMPMAGQFADATGIVVLVALEVLAVLALLGLYDGDRFHWCWRGVGAIIFLAYVAYFIAMAIEGNWLGDGRKADSNALNAVLGLLAFGLPGLWYAITGRLPRRGSDDDSELDEPFWSD